MNTHPGYYPHTHHPRTGSSSVIDADLWHVLRGTAGASSRARLLHAVDERPRNANQLAETVERHYKTVRHHLDVLMDHELVEKCGETYGVVYAPTDTARRHWDAIERIFATIE